MRKNREHGTSSVDAAKSTPSGGVQPSARVTPPPGHLISRRVLGQLLAMLGVSAVLGFTFNAASPVGVRFGDAHSSSSAATTAVTNSIPTTAVIAITNRVAALPPLPPPITEKPAATPTTNQAKAPVAISHQAQATNLPPAIATPFPTTPPAPTAELNPAPTHWALARPLVAAGQAVFVDVRAKGMYDAGHIPGAISLPETSSPEEFTAFLNQYPSELTLIIYCSSITCSQSARVAARLVTQYHRPSVKYMTGGYLEYQQDQARNPSGATP